MFGAIFKATNSYFQKGMTFCRSVYVKKVMKLLAFIFEQPSYIYTSHMCMALNRVCSDILHIHVTGLFFSRDMTPTKYI